jgi:thermitase
MKIMANMGNAVVRMRQFGTILFVLAGLLGMIALANPPSGKGNSNYIGGEGKGNVIFSNTILVKLTAQARVKLKVVGEDVNPSATGLASLDVICRDFGVKGFRSIVASGVHRDPAAAIHSWYKITLAGVEQRITLIEQTNDDALNLVYSGAEPLGRLMARLKQDSSVESVALESVVQALFIPNNPYYSAPYPTSYYGNIAQWAPQFIGAEQAWDSTLGDPSIIIAIVDTGIDANHPDLAGKVVLAKNFVKGEHVSDSFGHGTHVAGIAAAQINNGIGIAGICGRCSLMSIKVLGADGSGSTSNVASGITYATDFGARVINLSLGSSSRTTIIRDALDYALNNNVLPVVAMGNSDTDQVGDLSYWYSALSVGAVDQQGAKASFSNFGLQTDVTAPGVAVLSTMPTYPVTLNTQYGYEMNYDALSGTSMATPVVAGLAGLIFSSNPALTAAQVKGMIESSAGDAASFNLTSGFGPVHAPAAIALALQGANTTPTLSSLLPQFGSVLVRNVTFSTTVSDNVAVHHVDFVNSGARYLLPATSIGYPGVTDKNGKNVKNVSPTIAPWSSFFSSTTHWNGLLDLTVTVFDQSGNSTSNAGGFDIENTYVTKVFTTHICDPSRTDCPSIAWDAKFSLGYPAIAKERIEWFNSTFSSNYAGSVSGRVTDGYSTISSGVFPRYWTGNVFEYDFGPVFSVGSTNNIGASLGDVYVCLGKDCPITPGTAETDITVAITYPQ